MSSVQKIACPQCEHQFEVQEALQEALVKKADEEIRLKYQAYNDKLKADKQAFTEQQQLLKQEREQLDQLVAQKLTVEKQRLQQELKRQVGEEFQIEVAALKQDLADRQAQVQLFKEREIEFERKQNQLLTREKDLQLEFEKKMALYQQQQEQQYRERLENEIKDREAEAIRKACEESDIRIKAQADELEQRRAKMREMQEAQLSMAREKSELEEKQREMELRFEQQRTELTRQLEKQITDRVHEQTDMKIREKDEMLSKLKEQIEEMKRRAEQGSMQLQGEVQELALEELLKECFPLDEISEVGKGIRGADVVQTVRNKHFQACGRILYESKRTKHFSAEWVAKLKEDMSRAQADICVIVTEALPDGIDKIGLKDDVWICTFQDVKGLTMALRETLICCHQVTAAQSNKGDKMQLLYDYLTSQRFEHQLRTMVEGFTQLKKQIDDEKRVMAVQWKRREKQLEKIIESTTDFYGSIHGIAGNSMPTIGLMEGEPETLLEQAEQIVYEVEE